MLDVLLRDVQRPPPREGPAPPRVDVAVTQPTQVGAERRGIGTAPQPPLMSAAAHVRPRNWLRTPHSQAG